MREEITITGLGALSPLGFSQPDWYYLASAIRKLPFGDGSEFAAPLHEECEENISEIRKENPNYKRLDRTVIMAIAASRQALKSAGISNNREVAVNIGSSRGATHSWENFYDEFSRSKTGRVSSPASPLSTAGNISTWVAQDLQSNGLAFSHSLTCGSALHAVANALAWLQSGMCSQFLAGASEAPLTPFTISQMKALRIYSKEELPYPCLPFNGNRNTMVLGEGAAMFCLERKADLSERPALALITGFGTHTESIAHATSINTEGEAYYQAMKTAVRDAETHPDLIIAHAPGTLAGDNAEYRAVERLFGEKKPILYSNKWQIGHTLGAAGAMNLLLALDILKTQKVPAFPFTLPFTQKKAGSISNVLINAMGFGGNAVSVMISAK